ncbi:hypothetical protein FA15DRAFT_706477 [Coprinopsis marcescibilis]|uniref:Uncharacterized protein n=1 Tax=Coprinopsis marcescibilis TaxID=230819 RepID=A0A5C3KP90_COPMA|nr:hypothetical protein FA15DRAFT_706477 [Coprinopsis marcescibilis]
MAPNWTKEYTDEYCLVYAKSQYASFVVAIFAAGIQLFMMSYSVAIFLETPPERRKGREPYLLVGCLIFLFFTLSACVNMARPFNLLLEASDGIEWIQLASADHASWRSILSDVSFSLVFILGDGLLLYRCYLVLSRTSLWQLVLPVLTYLSAIALGICGSVLLYIYPELVITQTRISLGRDILKFVTNILITSTICFKLSSSYRYMSKSLPAKQLVVYKTVASILVESALPLTIAGIVDAIVFIIPTNTSKGDITGYDGDPKALAATYGAVSALYYALQAIAPLLIIFQVTTGRTWAATNKSGDTKAFSRSLCFNHGTRHNISGAISASDDDTVAEGR